MTTLNPYLNFPGNTEEAFTFYRSVFGGEFLGGITRFSDLPIEQHQHLSDEEKNKVMHISLPIGKNNILMATDALESMGHKLTRGNNYYISINTDSKEEADRLYNGLSEGGKIEMPISDSSWGSYFGMFKDKFDVQWMVSFDYPKEG